MKLRFSVNQRESFRRGVDAPDEIAEIEVQPGEIDPEVRGLIADRMDGIDVCFGWSSRKGHVEPCYDPARRRDGKEAVPWRIEATMPALAGLIEAVIEDRKRAKKAKNAAGKGDRHA